MLKWLRLGRLFKTAGRDLLTLLFACLDPALPGSTKGLAALMLLYVISPIDLVPDIFVLLGFADDLAVVLFGVPWLLGRVPTHVRMQAEGRAERVLLRFGFGRP